MFYFCPVSVPGVGYNTEQPDAIATGDGVAGGELHNRLHRLGERVSHVVGHPSARQLLHSG